MRTEGLSRLVGENEVDDEACPGREGGEGKEDDLGSGPPGGVAGEEALPLGPYAHAAATHATGLRAHTQPLVPAGTAGVLP